MDESSICQKLQGKVAIVIGGASGIGEATAQTIHNNGQLDIMFSNPGILNNKEQTILELDVLALDRLFVVNVRGMAACVKHAGRAMVDGGVKRNIICTASVAASIGSKRDTDYTMSKHAMLGLVQAASLQLEKHGIRVNCVSPSWVATPLACKAYGMDVEGVRKMASSHISLEGMLLEVDHVTEAVLFLALRRST